MTEAEAIKSLIDLGLSGLLLIGVIVLWRENKALQKELRENKIVAQAQIQKADDDRSEILTTVRELNFWSNYKGDNPPMDDGSAEERSIRRRKPSDET